MSVPAATTGGVAGAVRGRPVVAYFVLAFAFAWAWWIPVALAGGHVSHFPGLMGPMLASLVVTGVTGGRAGLRALGRRMVRWRVPPRWYAAVVAPAAVAAVVLAARAIVTGDAPSLGELSDLPGLPQVGWVGVFVLAVLVNGFGEEVGWRGFAWPALRTRHSLTATAFIIAVPWAVWHIPTFFIDSGMRGFPPAMIPGFFVGMAAGSVVLGWLYEHSQSLLIVALWHAMLNMASATRGSEGLVAAVVTTAVIVAAIRILRAEQAARPAATPPSASRRIATGTS